MIEEDRKAIEESLAEASEKGLYRMADIRPGIKLKMDTPKIAICVPIGDKDDPSMFMCDHCNRRHFGTIRCPHCDKDHPADKKLRRAGLVPMEWLLSAWQIVPPLLCSMQVQVRKSVLSARARNEMTYDAIKSGCKYIFYWDDDTIVPPKAIYDLHNMMERHPEAAIISGVYTTREPCTEPLVYKAHGAGAYWDFRTEPGELEEIFAAGAGCMMARVDALLEVDRVLGGPWWADEHDMKKIESGEAKILWGHDIRFCKRMWDLAEKFKLLEDGTPDPEGPSMPWKVYVAGWIQCLHLDVDSQVLYGLPPDAPCFKKDNVNNASYWDHVWGKEGQATWRTYPGLYDRIVELVPERSNVVDVGCGIGVLLDMLAKRKQTRGYGYDISPKAIDMLKSRWLDGEAQDVKDFELNHFRPGNTVVVATETIEHLDDTRLDRFLEQASKAKLAIFSTPNGVLEGTPEGEHVQVFDEKSLAKRARQYFEKVTVEKVEPHFLLAVCSGRKK